MNRLDTLASLKERLNDLSTGSRRAGQACGISGVPLRLGATHEWFTPSTDRRDWSPPLILLADLAGQSLCLGALARVVWIGRHVFPYPPFLDAGMLAASVFIDTPGLDARVWAIDMALRSAPAVIIADGHGLTLAHTRRLQLAASAGSSLGLLARPAHEEHQLSAAVTRWRVVPAPSPHSRVRWSLTLTRNKDHPTLTDGDRAWCVEWSNAEGLVAGDAAVDGRASRAASRTA